MSRNNTNNDQWAATWTVNNIYFQHNHPWLLRVYGFFFAEIEKSIFVKKKSPDVRPGTQRRCKTQNVRTSGAHLLSATAAVASSDMPPVSEEAAKDPAKKGLPFDEGSVQAFNGYNL